MNQQAALVNNRNTNTNSSSLEIEDISDSDREDNDGPENSSNPKEPHEPETDMAAGSSQAEVSGGAAVTAAAVPETNEKTPVKDPADMTLEERLKALDEKYQKWSGNSGPKGTPTPATPATPSGQTKKEPVLPSLTINNSNASGAQGATPKTCQTPVSEVIEIKSLNSASTTSSSGGSSGSTGSATTATPSGGATSKFSFDLKPTQPSPIVQKLLARKSIFDEDTKRLENLNSIDEPTENSEKPGNKTGLPKDSQDLLNCKQSVAVNDQLMTVGSVNFGSSSYSQNNISATPTEPSSIGANPGEHRFKLDRSMPVQDPKQQQSTPVRPMLNKLNSIQNLDSKSSSQVVTGSNPAGAVSIKNSASGLQTRNNSNSTTSSALVPSTPPIIGQVRPVAKPGLNPGILTASSVTMPIKPLVDNKIRPLQVSTKPSATVTPTFKTSSTTSHQATSGLRRNSTLTTTTASTKSLCTVTTNTSSMLAKAAAVEKGEASSTTSSPKITNNIEEGCDQKTERNSPESSTHPEAVSSCGLGENPKSLEQIIDESVSSTTKELNLDFKAKNSNNSDHSRDVKSGLKTKVELDPFGALIKDSTFAGKKTETLVNKVGIDGGPTNKVIKTEPGLNINTASATTATSTGTKPKHSGEKSGGGDRSKDRSGSHNSDKTSKNTDGSAGSSGRSKHGENSSKLNKSDVKSNKMKEFKDKELKELFATTDTIPNHIKSRTESSSSSSKHNDSASGHSGSKSHRKPSNEDHSGSGGSKSSKSDSKKSDKEHGSHGSHHGSHHHGHGSHSSSHSSHHGSSHHEKSHHKSSSSNKDGNKRRLSDATDGHPVEMGPKNKVPKVTSENVSFFVRLFFIVKDSFHFNRN
jgi:hypothetical protein